MQKQLLLVIFLLGFTVSKAANYYWIGGSGNWSDINHWATTSGGSILHSFVPTQNDNVFFDANSGFTTASRIVTVNTNAVCNNMIWSGAVNTPTMTGTSTMLIYGSMTLQPGMLYNVYTTEFRSSAAGQTITNAGSIGSNAGYFTFNGTGSWALQDSVNAPSLRFTLTAGSLSSNNHNMTILSFSSAGSLTRAFSLGTSTLTTKGVVGWGVTGTGMTMNAGTSTIILDYNDANTIWNTFTAVTGQNYNNVIFNQGGSVNVSTGVTFNSITFVGNGEIRDNVITNTLTFSANKKYKLTASRTITVNTQFNANPGSCGGWISIATQAPGNQATFSMPLTATVNVSNVQMQDIFASGGAVFTASNSVNEGNSSGWVFTPPSVNALFWIGGTGDWSNGSHWATTSGGAPSGCVPGPTTDVFFDAGSGLLAGVETVSISGVASCRDLTCAGAAAPPKLMSTGAFIGALNIYGSVALQAGMTYSVATFCKASAAATILSSGVQFSAPETASAAYPHVTLNGTGSWTLSDPFNVSGSLEFIRGTFNTNNQAVSLAEFSTVGSLARSLNLGASLINITTGTRWLYSAGTLNAGTSHIIFNSANAQLFSAPSHAYYDITFINQGELVTNTNRVFHNVIFLKDGIVAGQNRFNELWFSSNAVYKLSPLYTNTVTSLFNAFSPACNGWIRMESVTPGTQALINVPAAGTASVSNILMQDIGATGGATFNALNSVDNGNNSGWAFGAVTTNTLYWVGGAGNWSDQNHWSTVNNGIYPSTNPCVPGPGDDVFFNVNSGLTASSRTVTINTAAYCHNITCAGSAFAPAIIGAVSLGSLEIYGSAIMQSGGTCSGRVIFKSNNAETITSNGVAFSLTPGGFVWTDVLCFDGAGSWTLTDPMTVSKVLFFVQGTISTNNQTLTCGYFLDKLPGVATNTVGIRQLNLGSSLVNVTSGSSSWYYSQVNSSLNAGTSHINLVASGEFLGKPGHVYNDVTFRGSVGASTYRMSGTGFNFNNVVCLTNMEIFGSHVYNNLTFSGGKTYKLESTATQSVTSNFYPSGNPCFINFISAITPGSRANLIVQGGNVNYDYISITDVDATPSYATLQMAGHSTDAGNNLNITFAPTTTVGIAGLGPDQVHCQYNLPIVLNTTSFFPNPATTFTWTGGVTTSSLSVNAGGTYSVLVNYGAACTVTDAIVITANPTPTVAITGNTVICSGGNTTLTAGGASTYTWTSLGLNTNTVQLNPPSSTSYSVIGTSGAGCISAQAVINVSVNPTPSVGISSVSNPSICPGNTTTITPGGASSYTMQPGNATGTSFTVNPTVNTTYTITGASSAGCPSQNDAQQLITVSASPTVNIASVSSPSICPGNTVAITPGGASSYTMQPGNISGMSFTVSPTANTTYTISGSSASNCPSQNSVQQLITVSASPTVNIASVSSPSICPGNTATITPGGASSYTMQPGSMTGTSFTVSPAANTTYTITGSSASNCPSQNGVQQMIAVNANPVLAVSSVSNVNCFGQTNGSVSLTPSGGSGSGYVISPSSTSNLAPGTYTYTLTDANNCANTAIVSITQPTAALHAVVSSTTANTNCTAANGNASVSISGGTPSYTVSWSNGSTGTNVTNLNTGVHTYTVIDAKGCSDNSGSVTIQGVTGLNMAAVSQNSISCFGGSNGSLTYATTGGSSYTYTLTSAASSQTNTSGSFTNLPGGTYTVSVTESSSGCTDTDVITLTAPSSSVSASVNAGSILCYGNTATVSATVTGGTPGYTFAWSANTSITGTATYTAGTYSLSVTDANNCAAILQVFTISQPAAALTATVITSDNFSCNTPSGSATITPNGGTGTSQVTWSSGSAINSYTNTGLTTGAVTYTLTDANGCQLIGSATINGVPVLAVASFNVQDVNCYGQSTGTVGVIMTGGTPTYTYSWSNTGANVSSQSGLPAGAYVLTVTDRGNCKITQTLTVTEPAEITVTTISNSASCPGEPSGSAQISVSGGTPAYSVLWANGQSGLTLSAVSPGVQVATITDSQNCRVSYSVTIDEKSCKEIFVPEIMTPNGDGKNDRFVIDKIEDYPNNQLNIYNRWGNIVYSKDGYRNEFDGSANVGNTFSSGLLPSGTYYVVLDFGDNKTKTYTGYIELQY